MDTESDSSGIGSIATRGTLGGVLMGLANLVPGISGGTMLLATGVYTHFIRAVAEVTTFKFRARSLLLLGVIGVAAVLAIALLAGTVKGLVTDHRWVMYSLFIGLTLGGVPLVLRMARPWTDGVTGGLIAGFLVMAAMAFTPAGGAGSGGQWALLFLAGIAGASAMILPGVSGAYLLLVLGQYEVILGAVDQMKEAVRGDLDLAWGAFDVVGPVALGVLVGVVVVSNLLRWTLAKHEKATLGVLLGLLLGSVLGIWPFQEVAAAGTEVEPGVGAVRSFYAPTLGQVAAALGLVAAGFAVTLAIDRLGRTMSR